MVDTLDGRTKYVWFPVGKHKGLGLVSGSPEAAYMCTAEAETIHHVRRLCMQPILWMSSHGMTPLIEQNVFVLGSRNPPVVEHHGIIMAYHARRNISATLFH